MMTECTTLRPCRCCDGEPPETVGRYWSQFVSVYICRSCSAKETVEGFFWREKAEADALDIHDTRRSYVGK